MFRLTAMVDVVAAFIRGPNEDFCCHFKPLYFLLYHTCHFVCGMKPILKSANQQELELPALLHG